MKQCKKCKSEKPFIDFQKEKESKDGLAGVCKKCRNDAKMLKYHERKNDPLKAF